MDASARHAAVLVQIIRDSHSIVLGQIESESSTGRITARDVRGVIVGRFDTCEGLTRDASGRIVAHGNVLPVLLVRP